ncbi:nuclear transport factor 2 family protein [Inquilinus limosus]|uniref:nuclear transport factor 2 family protein n=1 Tax=Inquilinus limosus TaxID=171674 RepID=UPI003F153438
MDTTKADIPNLIRAYFGAYESKDRAAIEALVGEDFTFSSPRDDHIDRAAYFERCWPNSRTIRRFTIERLFDRGDEAFVLYELELTSGTRFRNVEHFRFEGSKIRGIVVYFGSLPEPGYDRA